MSKALYDFPPKSLVGVIAVQPLPGSPNYAGSLDAVVDQAMADLALYAEAGVEVILLENSWDVPYVKPPLATNTVEAMRDVAAAVRREWRGLLGLQMLEAANEEALDIAASEALEFIRVEGYVFGHIGAAGLIEGCAGRLLRHRRALDAEGIRVFADIKKKHCSHAITGDQTLGDHARQAELFLVDGLVVTGGFTGEPPTPEDLHAVRHATPNLPLLIGSGVTLRNLPFLLPLADAIIVGSAFREGGRFLAPTRRDHLFRFIEELQRLREVPVG